MLKDFVAKATQNVYFAAKGNCKRSLAILIVVVRQHSEMSLGHPPGEIECLLTPEELSVNREG
jgi:hypothetical protein